MKITQRQAFKKLREYRQSGVGIFIETLKLLVAFFQLHFSGVFQQRLTPDSLHMIGALTERDFQNLNKATIFFNKVGNKSISGKYFVKSFVCVLLIFVFLTFFIPLEM